MIPSEFHDFYQDRLQNYGASAQGVGWKNQDAQTIRFAQLYKLMDEQLEVSINDLGCGTGDFIHFLSSQRNKFIYRGYDLLPEMIQNARLKFERANHITFQVIESAAEILVSDYTIASGIFNIRFTTKDEDWLKEILSTIHIMDTKSIRGFAFNILSKYSDLEFRKNELYYADPGYLFDYCKRNFSKNVALLHDYDQYDFTIIVRKS